MMLNTQFKKITPFICSVALSLCASISAYADSGKDSEPVSERLTIEFVDPKSYTDIEPSYSSRAKFRKQVMKNFEEYFAEFTDALPMGQTLDVVITDIDLAGDTRSPRMPIGSPLFDVRVVEDIYFPRIKFTYTLKDDSGAVLKSEEVNLKDMAFLNRAGILNRNRHAFAYEREMISDWFKDTFEKDYNEAS